MVKPPHIPVLRKRIMRAESGIFRGRGSDDPDNKRAEHVYYQRVHGKDPRAVERDERHGVSRCRAYKPTRPDGKKIQHICLLFTGCIHLHSLRSYNAQGFLHTASMPSFGKICKSLIQCRKNSEFRLTGARFNDKIPCQIVITYLYRWRSTCGSQINGRTLN